MMVLKAILIGALLSATPDPAQSATARSEADLAAEAEALRELAEHEARRIRLEGGPEEGPCLPGSVHAREAGELLLTLSRAARGLAPGADPQPFLEAYARVIRHGCFWGAADFQVRRLTSDDPVKLREWWWAGGEHWLRWLLDGASAGRTVVFPPDLPKDLDLGDARTMKALACAPGDDADCRSGIAWRKRAHLAFKAAEATLPAACRDDEDACETSASDRSPYGWWVRCKDGDEGRSVGLPGGHFKPPTSGWLVVRTQHLPRCGTAMISSLLTGDTWSFNTCQEPKVQTGRVPVTALRELALLLIVSGEIDHNLRVRSVEVALPAGVKPKWTASEEEWLLWSSSCGHKWGVRFETRWAALLDGTSQDGMFVDDECFLSNQVMEAWTQQLQGKVVPGCVKERPPAEAIARLSYVDTRAHEETLKAQRHVVGQLEALLAQTPASCSGARPKAAQTRP